MTLSTDDWGTGKSRCRLNVAGFLIGRPPPPSDPHRCAVAAGRGSEYRRAEWGSNGPDLVRSLALVMGPPG